MSVEVGPQQDLVSTHFLEIAKAYLPEMKQLFREGKLLVKDGWDNVSAHCILESLLARQLGLWLQLPIPDVDTMIRVALVHDWNKRLEVKPSDFTEEEKKIANQTLAELQIDQMLLASTGIEFVKKYSRGEPISLLEKLQLYIDDICNDRSITLFDDRLDEVSARKKYLNDDEELTAQLNGVKYWDAERAIGRKIEQEIFYKLKEHGIIIGQPSNIPLLLEKALASSRI